MSESAPGRADSPTENTYKNDSVVCPTCDRDDFKNNRGMKIHHKKAHGETIKVTVQCERCGTDYDVREPLVDDTRFCSQECQLTTLREERDVNKEEATCEHCGSIYEDWPSQLEGSKYCSWGCKVADIDVDGEKNPNYNGGDVSQECEWCEGEYSIPEYKSEDSRFCSRLCFSKHRSENVVGEDHPSWKGGKVSTECYECGEVVDRKQNVYEKYENHFCSQECRSEVHASRFSGEDHPNWKENSVPQGDAFYSSEEWKETREELLDRDNYQCQYCGDKRMDLHGHHIIPRSDGGADYDLNNLVTLCNGCHNTWEGLYLRPDTRGQA